MDIYLEPFLETGKRPPFERSATEEFRLDSIGKEINDLGDFKSETGRIKKGDAALFLIYRDGNTFYRVLKVDK